MNTPLEILSRNVQGIQSRIVASAERADRDPADVQLVAVTKYVESATVRLLAEAGLTVFGESRPQALWQKYDELQDLSLDWHLIGHLQRNKVRRTLPMVSTIHSIDSLRLLKEVEKNAALLDLKLNILLEVNISGEQAKHGLQQNELAPLLDFSMDKSAINVVGLMGMGGLASNESETRSQFASLRTTRDQLATDYAGESIHLHHLSMGMSKDFEWAIEEGATMVRIGSILFEGLP